MPTLSNLKIDLTLETAKFNAQAKKAKSGLGAIVNEATLIKGALAGLAVGSGLAVLVKQSINAADELGKLSTRLGVTVEELSQLQHMASLTGVSNRELATSMQRSTRRIAEASHGYGEAVKALDTLGLSAKKLSKLTPGEQFYALADALEAVPEQGDKVALSMKLLDSEGVKLLQTFAGGSEQMRKMAEQADALGITMSESTARAAEQFNDNLTVLAATNRGFINKLTAELMPTLNNVSGMMVAAATDTDTLNSAASLLEGTLKSLVTVGVVVSAAFEATGNRIAATAAAMTAVASGDFKLAWNIAKAGAEDFEATASEAIKSVEKLWSDSGSESAAAATRNRAAIIDASNAAAKNVAGGDGKDSAIEAMNASVDKQVLALNAQAAALSMSEREAGLFKLTLAGATVEQLASADAALAVAEAYKTQATAANDAAAGASALEGVRQGLLSERDALQEHYELRRQIILDNTEAESVARNDLLSSIDEKHAKEQLELTANTTKEKLRYTKELFGNLAFLANNENEKLADIGRAAAIVQATIDGYVAAQKALAQGGPIAGPIMAASIGILTAANIAGIAGARALGGNVVSGEQYLVGEQGPELFTPKTSGNITPNNKMGEGGGDVIVNIVEDASKAGTVSKSQDDITVYVAAAIGEMNRQISNGGGIATNMEKRYGLNRSGR